MFLQQKQLRRKGMHLLKETTQKAVPLTLILTFEGNGDVRARTSAVPMQVRVHGPPRSQGSGQPLPRTSHHRVHQPVLGCLLQPTLYSLRLAWSVKNQHVLLTAETMMMTRRQHRLRYAEATVGRTGASSRRSVSVDMYVVCVIAAYCSSPGCFVSVVSNLAQSSVDAGDQETTVFIQE
jgi:hypothetical protein